MPLLVLEMPLPSPHSSYWPLGRIRLTLEDDLFYSISNKMWGAKGTPGSGQATSVTYQVTVVDNTGGGGGGGGGGTIVDAPAPTVKAPSAANVVKGKKATLKYRVDDAAPNLGTAKAGIKIKKRKGKVVKTIEVGAKAVNVVQKATFTCKLAKGTYKFYVTATDAAGNRSVKAAVNKLTVR